MKGAKYAPTVFAAVCLPLFLGALTACSAQKKSEEMKVATESVLRLQDGVVDFASSQQRWPSKMDDLKVGGDELPGVSYTVGEGGVVAVYFAEGSALPGAHLIYEPSQDQNGNVTWSCKSVGLDAGLKPAGCA